MTTKALQLHAVPTLHALTYKLIEQARNLLRCIVA